MKFVYWCHVFNKTCTKSDSKESRNYLDSGLKFLAPVVTKSERPSPRVSESSDVSASDSSHSSFQVVTIIIILLFKFY